MSAHHNSLIYKPLLYYIHASFSIHMKRFILVFATIVFGMQTWAQQVPAPADFLGYPVGTKFTRHHRVVEYFKSVAQSRPDLVKLEQYGLTNEGRPLMLAFITAPANLQRLNEIRQNNLRLAGLAKDKVAPTENTTPIVWLSYNVHGNEASSSEAAMLTLHTLTNPANAEAAEWLKQVVVVIDPCINPDGRDRYINWYNSVVGKNMNVDPQSREHIEPWPGGRSNHYNFDLNRDWAWQTQVETQQRLKVYNTWMPQIHVDFHEQGYNEPYYFAPAAEPFHDVITNWQRDFQTAIGKNHARYFDKNGWLFFTKERFDLLYPSYGDTYPTYNGAIGMTYEQGGHSRGGLGVINEDGDTLTLVDRATHHYTTGISTIEISAKNAAKLVTEFKKFFDDCRSGKPGEYKTYVMTSKDEARIRSLAALLEKNGIEFGTISNKVFRGFNYATGKDDAFTDEGFHLAVSAFQPRSAMAKVLLEPRTFVSDSNTYDITAWSLPYAYGVKAFAVKEKLDVQIGLPAATPAKSVQSDYGVIIPYTSLNSAKALAYILKQGVKVRYTEKPFSYKGVNYDRGTLLILKTSNTAGWLNTVNEAIAKFQIKADAVETGFMDRGPDFGSPDIKMMQQPKVVLVTGEQTSSLGAGEVWNFFDHQLDYPLTLVNAADLGRTNLKNYNVVIIPDGFYRSLTEKAVADKLKEFVRGGGKIIAMENAAVQMAGSDWGAKMKEDKDDSKTELQNKYADRERQWLTNSIPGAIYKVDIDNTHPLGYALGDTYYTLKTDANLMETMKGGWNVGVLKKDAHVSGFAGVKVKNKLKDGTLFAAQDMGGGSVVYLIDNPLFRLFWENGKLLFANALFMAGN